MRFVRPLLLLALAGLVLSAVFVTVVQSLLWWAPGAGPGSAAPPAPMVEPAKPIANDGDLRFLQEEIDFGLIKGPIRRDVEIENRGPHVVRILGVKSSCGCTVTEPDRKTVPPGEKGRITLAMDPRSEWALGRVVTVSVDYEDTARHEAQLTVHVRYRPDVEIPESIDIRSVAAQSAVGGGILRDHRRQPLSLTELTTSAPDLQVEALADKFGEGRQYYLSVTYSGGKRPPGHYTESLTLHTTDSAYKTIEVKVGLQIVKRIQVAPETVLLKADPNDSQRYVGKVSVDDAEGSAVEFDAVSPSDEHLLCQLDARGSARRVIEVSLRTADRASVRPPMTIRIRLKTSVGEELSVPVVLDPQGPSAGAP
jgi:hypothetical protein